jgi:hypothetical protein
MLVQEMTIAEFVTFANLLSLNVINATHATTYSQAWQVLLDKEQLV